jgi:hypothetical protein
VRVTISHNIIGPGRLNFLSSHGGDGRVEDIDLLYNRSEGRNLRMSFKTPEDSGGCRRSRIRIIGNTTPHNAGGGKDVIGFQRMDDIDVRDNVQPLAERCEVAGVGMLESCRYMVVGNDFGVEGRDLHVRPYTCRL